MMKARLLLGRRRSTRSRTEAHFSGTASARHPTPRHRTPASAVRCARERRACVARAARADRAAPVRDGGPRSGPARAPLAGSHVEGLATATSDLDLFQVLPDAPERVPPRNQLAEGAKRAIRVDFTVV